MGEPPKTRRLAMPDKPSARVQDRLARLSDPRRRKVPCPLIKVATIGRAYLCWFFDTVEGYENVKQAIAALPGFSARLAKHRERKQLKDETLEQRIEEVVCRMFAVEPSPAELDALCDELFHGQAD
jgi:hypothetical protein